MIAAVLESLGVPASKVHFVHRSFHKLSGEFTIDNHRFNTLVDEQDIRDTGDECRNCTKLSVLVCPGLPALAEEYLDADFKFGGEDQI